MSEPTPTKPSPKVRSVWRSWALEIGLALAVMFGMHLWQTRNAVSGPAPSLEAQLLDGTPFSLGTPRDRPLLVHFWATWCGVCNAEAGNIEALAKEHDVLTVATDSGSAAEVAAHLSSHGLTWRTVNDPGGKLSRQWGVRAFPTSFVIDRSGQIRFSEVGYTTTLGLRARLWWAGR